MKFQLCWLPKISCQKRYNFVKKNHLSRTLRNYEKILTIIVQKSANNFGNRKQNRVNKWHYIYTPLISYQQITNHTMLFALNHGNSRKTHRDDAPPPTLPPHSVEEEKRGDNFTRIPLIIIIHILLLRSRQRMWSILEHYFKNGSLSRGEWKRQLIIDVRVTFSFSYSNLI